MPEEAPSVAPSLPWRTGSTFVMGVIGVLSKSILYGCNRVEVNGLDCFVELLSRREDVDGRQRGLITVSNHLSVLDDPGMWGVLPWRFLWNPDNARWSLGSHDVVFRSKALSTFFALGQVLPTHRKAYSPHGGLFQPTMTETIRLLSRHPFSAAPHDANSAISDPFSANQLTYTTDGHDSFPCPSAYATRRHAWVHIFPEGRIHQKADKTMRYFKWGVSRLILESEPCPDMVPIWIEGFDHVMHESRQFPRFVPRPGNDVAVTFGREVDMEARFGDLRRRWQVLVRREQERSGGAGVALGVTPEALKHGQDAVRLREECTFRVREEVLKVRRQRGWPDEDPKARLVDTWREEGESGKREGRMEDGSWVKDT